MEPTVKEKVVETVTAHVVPPPAPKPTPAAGFVALLGLLGIGALALTNLGGKNTTPDTEKPLDTIVDKGVNLEIFKLPTHGHYEFRLNINVETPDSPAAKDGKFIFKATHTVAIDEHGEAVVLRGEEGTKGASDEIEVITLADHETWHDSIDLILQEFSPADQSLSNLLCELLDDDYVSICTQIRQIAAKATTAILEDLCIDERETDGYHETDYWEEF